MKVEWVLSLCVTKVYLSKLHEKSDEKFFFLSLTFWGVQFIIQINHHYYNINE